MHTLRARCASSSRAGPRSCRRPRRSPFASRPPGLVEWIEAPGDLPPDLRVAIDAANPALAFVRFVVGERPELRVEGDAAFATDVNWLIENLRWDVRGRPGAAGRRRAGARDRPLRHRRGPGDPRDREDARRLCPAAATVPAGRRHRPDEAPRPADLHLGHGLSLRSGRARAVELSPALGPRAGPRSHRRPSPRRRRAACACASRWRRLGPIFVKFGQVLSTRRDLLPADIADELAKLQDRVPPFPASQARATVERAFGRPIETVFASFDARAGGQRLDRPGALRGPEGRRARSRSRCCARACWRRSTTTSP